MRTPSCMMYRKSSILSRPTLQVYSNRSQTILTCATPTYHQKFTFRAFLGSLGAPLLPLEKCLL